MKSDEQSGLLGNNDIRRGSHLNSDNGDTPSARGKEDHAEVGTLGRLRQWTHSQVFVLREVWESTPFSARILSIPAILLALALILVGLTVDAEVKAEQAHLEHYPVLIDKFMLVMERLIEEDIASQDFIHRPSDYELPLLTARQSLDDAIDQCYTFYKANQDMLKLSVTGTFNDPTVPSELQFSQLFELRSRILPTPLLSSGVSSEIYQGILQRMADLLKRFALHVNSGSGSGREWPVWIANLQILHSLERSADADEVLHLPVTASHHDRTHAIALFLEHNRVSSLTQSILSILLPVSEFNVYMRALSAAQIDSVFKRLDHDLLVSIELPANWTTLTEYNQFQNSTRNLLVSDLKQLRSFRLAVGTPSAVNRQVHLRVMLGVLAAFLACIIGYLIFDRLTDTESAHRLKASYTIREAIARVREYAVSFENFSLNPPPAPDGMMGTTTGEIELRLGHCLASLRSLAPFLPPLLLPHRSVDTTAEIAKIRSIEKGQTAIQRVERGQIQTSDLEMLAQSDIEDRKSAKKMALVTDLMMEDTNAVCLTIDLSQLHAVMTNSKSSVFISKAYQEIIGIVEEKVLNAGGIFTSVVLDYATAIWHGPNALAEFSLIAAQTASGIAKELNAIRRTSAQLQQVLKPRLSVTAGPVTVGIFGDDDFKTMQVFGPAVMLGSTVAHVNKHHATTVLCDEQVRSIVERTYPCKPIELLLNGDVCYEVVHPQRGREEDMESRLSVYNRAFGLFRQNYYREALKAFRGYTKQYGYDRSVERIQSLMTGE